jgi:DNA gyrase/topoisomerase IV subunit A
MDKNIPCMYKRYGNYINSNRSFPLAIDGLKPVERRILLVAYQIAKDKFVKSARIDGTTIAKYHPHSSVYSSIVQLANQGFLNKQGNFGNNLGTDPSSAAASRYTEVKLSQHIDKIVFSNLLKYVPWELQETDENEPKFLPSQYPLCFLGKEYTMGIGFGYRTLIPCYHENDLKNRLKWLLKMTQDEPVIKPITGCTIISDDSVLRQLLTTGKSQITVKGDVSYDPIHCKATLKSWGPGKKFETIYKKFSDLTDNGEIGFSDLSNEENGTHIVFNVLKQRNRDKIFKQFKEIMELAIVSNISFEITVVENNKVCQKSVDEMLLNTYNMYKQINQIMLKHEIERYTKIVDENNLLLKIRPLLIKEMQSGEISPDIIISNITKILNISDENIIKILFDKYKISKLLTIKTDITNILEKIENLNKNLTEIDTFINIQYGE